MGILTKGEKSTKSTTYEESRPWAIRGVEFKILFSRILLVFKNNLAPQLDGFDFFDFFEGF